MRVHNDVLRTVVFLGQIQGGEFVPYGTAFLVASIVSPDRAYQTLVTAKHVVEDMGDVEFVYARLNDKAGQAQVIGLARSEWYSHPDPRVDVIVCPTIIPKDQFDLQHYPLLKYTVPSSFQPEEFVVNADTIKLYEVGIGDEVYLAGMFIGRLGEASNVPVLRIGTIAAMSGEPIETKYGIHEAFLIEVRSIDGLSGSPVCVHLWPGRYIPRRLGEPLPAPGSKRTTNAAGFLLMGMVLGYNEVFTVRDIIEIRRKGTEEVERKEAIPLNTGIAVVLPMWKIIEAVEQDAIRQKREEALKKTNKEKGRGSVPTSAAPPIGSGPSTTANNPSHKEDFTSLVERAAKKKPPAD